MKRSLLAVCAACLCVVAAAAQEKQKKPKLVFPAGYAEPNAGAKPDVDWTSKPTTRRAEPRPPFEDADDLPPKPVFKTPKLKPMTEGTPNPPPAKAAEPKAAPSTTVTAAPAAPKPVPVAAQAAWSIRGRPLFLPNCQVKVIDEVQIPAQLPGKIAEILVKEGDVVQKGQILAQLDDHLAKIDLELKKAARTDAMVKSAQIKRDYGKIELEIAEKLHAKQQGSKEDLEERRLKLALAMEEINAEVAKLDQTDCEIAKSEAQLKLHTIKAPISGVILKKIRQAGEEVQAQDPVLHLVSSDRLKVEGYIDVRYADALQRGVSVEVQPNRYEPDAVSISHPNAVHAVRILPDRKRMAYGCKDGSVTIWNLGQGMRDRVIAASTKPIRCIAASAAEPDCIITAGDEGVIRFWSLRDGSEYRGSVRASEYDSKAILSIAVDPTDPTVGYTGDEDGRIHVWDWKEGKVVRTLAGHVNGVTSLSLSADRRQLMSVGFDGTTRIWNVATGEHAKFAGRTAADKKEVRQMNFSPDGKSFAFNSNALLQVRRLSDGLPTEEVENQGGRRFAHAAVFTPTAGMILVAQDDGQIQLWQLPSGRRPSRLVRSYPGHSPTVEQIDVSSDGVYFTSVGDDGWVRVWMLPQASKFESERLNAVVTYVSPQAEPGMNKVKFYAEVDNRKGVLRANTPATIVVQPGS